MRVAFIDRYGANSIWSVLHPLAAQLIEQGHQVVFIKVDDGKQRETLTAPSGVCTQVLKLPPATSPFMLIIQQFILWRRLRALLHGCSFDLIHGNFIYPAWAARVVASRIRLPFVNTRHEIKGSMSWYWRLLDHLTERHVLAHVFISDVVAESFGHLKESAYRHRIIKNGIDVTSIREYARIGRLGITRPRVICAGRFVPVKGQATLITAWPTVLEKFPNAKLCLPGDGPDRAALEERCQALGIVHSVEFPGWLPREKTLERASESSLMVVPSDGSQEGFGLVVAEAMALGIPLVCSDIPVFREVAADTADYFSVGNANALSRAIIRAFSDPVQAEVRASSALLRVAEHFDQRDMVAEYLCLYEQLAQ